MEGGSTEFFCRFSSLGTLVGSLVRGRGAGLMSVVIWRGVSEHIKYSSDGIICGY